MIPKIKGDNKKDLPIYFELEYDNSGNVRIVGTDMYNTKWTIATLNKDGIFLWTGIQKESGIPINSDRSIKITNTPQGD